MIEKLKRNKEIIGFGIALALLLLILQFLEYNLIILSSQIDLYIAIMAIGFTIFGIWISKKITNEKTQIQVIEKEIYISNELPFQIDQKEIEKLKISKRELEVLELMAKGLSNQEIANKLFVSLNTIKTHSSNLFEKLNVKRRTQAIELAKKIRIIS